MSNKKQKPQTDIGNGLRFSLESLQGALDDWNAVEKQVKEGSESPKQEKSDQSDPLLFDKLLHQLEALS